MYNPSQREDEIRQRPRPLEKQKAIEAEIEELAKDLNQENLKRILILIGEAEYALAVTQLIKKLNL